MHNTFNCQFLSQHRRFVSQTFCTALFDRAFSPAFPIGQALSSKLTMISLSEGASLLSLTMLHQSQFWSFWRRSRQPITWLILTQKYTQPKKKNPLQHKANVNHKILGTGNNFIFKILYYFVLCVLFFKVKVKIKLAHVLCHKSSN